MSGTSTTATLRNNMIPSAARTVSVPADSTTTDGTTPIWSPAGCRCNGDSAGDAIRLPSKSSADVLDYTVDFSAWLGSTGDLLTGTPSFLLLPETGSQYDPSVVWSAVYQGTAIVFVLASGRPGTGQKFSVSVATEQGRTVSRDFYIQITGGTKPVLPPASGSPVVLTSGGKDLTAGAQTLSAGTA